MAAPAAATASARSCAVSNAARSSRSRPRAAQAVLQADDEGCQVDFNAALLGDIAADVHGDAVAYALIDGFEGVFR